MRFPLIGVACLLASCCLGQEIREGLVIGGVVRGGRTPFPADSVAHLVATGAWQAPQAGQEIVGPDGAAKVWTPIAANADGWFEHQALGSGYVFATVESEKERIAILEAQAHSAVVVNGELRAGDPYAYGWLRLPVRLKQGRNELLFACSRGRLKAMLTEPKGDAMLNVADATLPDVFVGRTEGLLGAVVVINASDKPLRGWRIRTTSEREGRKAATEVPQIPPLSIRKVPIHLKPPKTSKPEDVAFALELLDPKGRRESEATLALRVRKTTDVHKRTFVSDIDGSVQYFAVNPAQKPFSQNALIFTLHGASVEALGQAEAYASKDWATIVAPTNRRPFGFDWEDWGRLDALEVMEIAKRDYPHDPARVSLTGHSMGGHGTWSLGATFPGRFAAIAPSAGWESFWTYSGAFQPAASGVEQMLRSAMHASDTALLARNLLQPSIYVLHGDADDNVPVKQARDMKQRLESLGKTVRYHEQKGAGHWWDDDRPGAACVDWPPMFEMLRSARIPSHPVALDFTTPNTAISATHHWLTIEQQLQSNAVSRAAFALDGVVLSGTTENVARLTIDFRRPQLWGLSLRLDEQPFRIEDREPVTFEKAEGRWIVSKPPSPAEKNPARGGPFKQAFSNRFVLVYGTVGTPEENAWAEQKARYDAETFYYRGNGAVEVLSDSEFGKVGKHSNAILYGNADTNSAWEKALDKTSIAVRRGIIDFQGADGMSGVDLLCLFVAPRKGSDRALVGVVSGTSVAGMRLTNRLPYFVSGCAYPDWVVAGPEAISEGPGGVRRAGFYGNDWSLMRGVASGK